MFTYTDKNGNLHTFMTMEDRADFIANVENAEATHLTQCDVEDEMPTFFTASLKNNRYYLTTCLAEQFIPLQTVYFVIYKANLYMCIGIQHVNEILKGIKDFEKKKLYYERKVTVTSANGAYISPPSKYIKTLNKTPTYATFKMISQGVYNVEHFGTKV